LGEKGGANLYAFVFNCPNTYIDSFGLESVVGQILSDAWYSIGQLRNLPSQIAQSYSPESTTMQVIGTAGYTVGEIAMNSLLLPYNLIDTGVDFFADPSIETTPIVGSIYVTTDDLVKDQNAVTISRAIGAYSAGVLTVVGIKYSVKVTVERCKFERLIKEAPTSGEIVYVGERAVIQEGQFVNRMFDSRYGQVDANVSGPLGRSFSPGSGIPTTAREGIQQRGLNMFYPNNAQEAIIYRVKEPVPAIKRTSIGGTVVEILIEPQHWDKLEVMRQFSVTQ